MKWAPTDVPADTQAFEAWSKTISLRDLWFPYSPRRYSITWSTRAELDDVLGALQRFPITTIILRDVDHDEPQATLLIAYFIDKLNIPTMRTLEIGGGVCLADVTCACAGGVDRQNDDTL